MPKPTFLFIGPDKTGSTWLYELLRRHPECYVPPIKDIYFFDRHYERGLDWYLAHFAEATGDARALGELSHDYLFSEEAAERIARDLPEVKLLTCLRDPVARTFSHYLFMVRSGRTKHSFEEALERYPELIDNSRYAKHLSRYFDRFPRSQIKAVFFEDLKRDPRAFASEIFEFLGLSCPDDLPYERRFNTASRPRNRLVARAAKLGANTARQLGLTRLLGTIKRNPLIHRVLYRAYSSGDRPSINLETESELRQLFQPDIKRLQELIAGDLSSWMSSWDTRLADRIDARGGTRA